MVTTGELLKRYGWWLAGLSVIGLMLAAVLGTGENADVILSIFSTRFLGIFIEAVPFLLLGSLVSGLLGVFVSPDDIARFTPRNPVLATVAGAFMGFVFPVCECGIVPVVRRLYNKGLPMSIGITFLLAAPVMNPIVLVSTYIAFGMGPLLIGRFVITAVVAIAVGLVFALNAKPQEVLLPQSLAPVMGGSGKSGAPIPVYAKTHRPPFLIGLRESLFLAGDEFFEMGRFLIIGSMLAAAMQTLVAQDVLLALGEGPIISVLVMQVFAFVLSVCSTVDAFLALAFVGTFTTGSILAFLTFGPMVDIKSMLMFLGVFRRKTVAYLVVLPFLMTLLIGIWINLNLAL